MCEISRNFLLFVIFKRIALFVTIFPVRLPAKYLELPKGTTKAFFDCWYKIKTIYNTYVSFLVSVTENDFPLTHDTAVLIELGIISPFPDTEQLNEFLILTHMLHRITSPGEFSKLAIPTSGPVALTDEASEEGATAHT